jgi:Sodium:dicarboxylate symporter family
MINERRRPLYRQLWVHVLIAMAAGAVLGYVNPDLAKAMKPLGDGFIKLIRMVIAPIVFVTVVSGICKMQSTREVGRIGVRACGRIAGAAGSGDQCRSCKPRCEGGGFLYRRRLQTNRPGISLEHYPLDICWSVLRGPDPSGDVRRDPDGSGAAQGWGSCSSNNATARSGIGGAVCATGPDHDARCDWNVRRHGVHRWRVWAGSVEATG